MSTASPRFPRPALTTDVVVFTIRDEGLEALLIRRGGEPFQGMWALPGGFVGAAETLEQSAMRELAEETGVRGVYLEQLYTFGDPDRDPRGRVVSVAHYALIPSDRLQLRAATDAQAIGWFPLDELPTLAFDHARIVEVAHERLAAKLAYSTIAFQFMGATFTLTELQAVYEIILNQRLDKRNFRKRILALDQVEGTSQKRRNGNHRPARLYRVKNREEVQIIR